MRAGERVWINLCLKCVFGGGGGRGQSCFAADLEEGGGPGEGLWVIKRYRRKILAFSRVWRAGSMGSTWV